MKVVKVFYKDLNKDKIFLSPASHSELCGPYTLQVSLSFFMYLINSQINKSSSSHSSSEKL